jgi:small multidrug resistance pump
MSAAWLLVAAAIVAEVSAAWLLRRSDGFANAMPAVGALAAFALAFYCVSRALVDLPVSNVYPVWAGGGTAGAALVGVVLLGERIHRDKFLGVVAVVAGIVLLNLTAAGSALS